MTRFHGFPGAFWPGGGKAKPTRVMTYFLSLLCLGVIWGGSWGGEWRRKRAAAGKGSRSNWAWRPGGGKKTAAAESSNNRGRRQSLGGAVRHVRRTVTLFSFLGPLFPFAVLRFGFPQNVGHRNHRDG